MIDDEKLLLNLKKRKRGSLEKAIDIYTPYASVIIYNIIGAVMTKEDVEEAVSDVFVSLWRSAEALDSSKGCIRTYIGTIAQNCAKKKLRNAAVHSELNDNITAVGSEPHEKVEEKEEQELLLKLIKDLGEPDSEIFLRHYWYNERISKISAVTGICKSTITTKLQRGRKKLKKVLMQKEDGDKYELEKFENQLGRYKEQGECRS